MTRKQRAHYFTRLWPDACTAQGWNEQDEAMRRDVTLEATGKTSTGALTQDEITALWRLLEYLADPLDLAKAILVSSPEEAQEQNRRRQLLHVIDRHGFDDAYVARCSDGLCAAEDATSWRELSSAALLGLSFTIKTRARQRDAKEGKRDAFIPRSVPYHQRPETKRKKAAAREPQVIPRPGVATSDSLLPF